MQIANYSTTEQIYNGNRTIVYRGICSDTGKPVVIKLLKKDYPTFNEIVQFRNQYAITKNLDLAGIVKPLALETYGNGLALIMEDDSSISLSEELKTRKNKHFSLAEFFPIAIQLTEILEGLSQNRIIHKDIKPANILIHPETKQVKLIDFSISSLLPKEQQEIQNPNILEGTLAYISPEQTGRMNRGIDYRSDFYSLGVTFYQLLTGKLPFESDDAMELVHCHLARTALPLGERVKGKGEGKDRNSPSVLSDIVMKLMAKNAEERYQSALGLKHDLEKCWQQWQETGKIETFELGERDICDRFLIPEKLYGREQEVQTLLESFNRVAEGQSEMMLVAGFSGIGKTAVVNEVHKPIVEKRGYFIKGKYDQFNRNIPFSAFVQAFRDLIGQLLGESDNELANWKGKILEAVGDNGQVLIEVIPELEQVIGQQPTATELSGTAAQNRFNLLFQKFIAVFTTPEHPLVMFLDDLQWADSASLNLMKVLMGESENEYLLLLGAYRDNEVFPAHPLMLSLDELEEQEAAMSTITLAPLPIHNINQLIAETLSCSSELAQPLTKLVYRKTKGNPFFTTQFLKGLQGDELIVFNAEQGYWECDLIQVQDAALTDDVVEFMASRLRKLPQVAQNLMKLAACIGNQFDLETLAIVCESPVEHVAADLWIALREGLVIPITEAYKFFQTGEQDKKHSEDIFVGYRFLHDRVQQAAYSLIPEDEKQRTHLTIGQLLLQRIPKSEREEKIFDIVNHLNMGVDLITGDEEKQQLCKLNLQAGCKAKNATAYEAAIEYLLLGIELLAENSWENEYEITLALYESATESAYLNGDFAKMEQLAKVGLENAQNLLDTLKLYEVKIQALEAQALFQQALDTAMVILAKLGIRQFPKEPDSSDIELWLREVKDNLGDRHPTSLVNLPEMTEPNILAAMRILFYLIPTTYKYKPTLMVLITFEQVNLSLQYGNSPVSTYAYSVQGLLSCNSFGEIEKGYQFGQLALNLEPQSNAIAYGRAFYVMNSHIKHYKKHLITSIKGLKDAYAICLELGDLEFAGYALAFYSFYSYISGTELSELAQEMSANSIALERINKITSKNWVDIYRQIVDNLLGQSQNPCKIVGEAYDEEKMLPLRKQANDLTTQAYFYIPRIFLCYLFQDWDGALESIEHAENCLGGATGTPLVTLFYFYQSLVMLAKFALQPENECQEQLEKLSTNQTILKNTATYAPTNYLHKWYLVEAEKCRVLGKKTEAMELYDTAIEGAKENEYIQEEALANELFAKLYLDWGKEKYAALHMQEAYYCYARWGATAKVEQLQTIYPQLLAPILQTQQEEHISKPALKTSSPSFISTHTSLSESLDLATVLKASQSLSQEIHLERLLCVLMEVIVTNAGANQGILLWLKDENLSVAAHWQEDNQCQLPNLPVEQYPHLPLSLINTVKRSQETIIVNQGQLEKRWIGDSYLREHEPQSYLCTPILHQGKLLTLLYLENKLTPEAFTEGHLEILTMLTSQAAISLENAQLYQQLEAYSQTLEEKVEQRTAELKSAQKQLIAQEKLASLGALTAGVAHELRNPLNFVTNYAEGSMEMETELIAELDKQNYPSSEEDWGDFKEIITDLKDNSAAIHHHGQRAESIIYNMMQHSRSDDSSPQLTDINKLVDEARQLAYHSKRSRDNSFNITFTTEYDESVGALEIFSASLNRALINLIDNGCYAAWKKYVANGQKVSPQLWITTKNLGKEIEIHIRDNGKGIPDEVQEKIFEPFFTTKPTGEGTGLGLSLTHEIIVGQHGGTLKVNTEPGSFTEFILALPKKLDFRDN